MNRRKHSSGNLIAGLMVGFLAMVWSYQAFAQPTTTPAVPDSTDNLTGTLLFINGRPQTSLPVAVAELRATCVSRLEAALRGKGHRTVDRSIMEAQVMKWRIRSNRLMPEEFLRELRRDHDVGQVLVVTLLSDNRRFLMTTRLVDTETGLLISVNLMDVDLPDPETDDPPAGPMEWRWILDGICREIVPLWSPALKHEEEPMLVLPTRGIASDPEITSAAGHSLLKILLEHGIPLIDPSIVEVTMLEAAIPSNWLNPEGCRLLQNRFSSNVILVSELVSYDSNKLFQSLRIYDRELPDVGKRNLVVFSMTLRAVDLNTGTTIRSAQIMHDKPPATGWFGNPIHSTLLQELETTSHELWAAFSPEAEDD